MYVYVKDIKAKFYLLGTSPIKLDQYLVGVALDHLKLGLLDLVDTALNPFVGNPHFVENIQYLAADNHLVFADNLLAIVDSHQVVAEHLEVAVDSLLVFVDIRLVIVDNRLVVAAHLEVAVDSLQVVVGNHAADHQVFGHKHPVVDYNHSKQTQLKC